MPNTIFVVDDYEDNPAFIQDNAGTDGLPGSRS
jgi:hypothetical protein